MAAFVGANRLHRSHRPLAQAHSAASPQGVRDGRDAGIERLADAGRKMGRVKGRSLLVSGMVRRRLCGLAAGALRLARLSPAAVSAWIGRNRTADSGSRPFRAHRGHRGAPPIGKDAARSTRRKRIVIVEEQ